LGSGKRTLAGLEIAISRPSTTSSSWPLRLGLGVFPLALGMLKSILGRCGACLARYLEQGLLGVPCTIYNLGIRVYHRVAL
jgi:hypothetical protein